MDTGLLSPVVQRLVQLLDDEVRLVGGVKDEVSSLQRQLRFINTYLEGSEGIPQEDPIAQVVFQQIREKADEAVVVIEKFISNAAKHARRNRAKKIFYGFHHTRVLHNVAKRIKSIKEEINKIFDDGERFACVRPAAASVDADFEEAPHISSRRREVEEDGVVAFNNNSEALMKLFTAKDSELDVISIIGMGGLGKTTLAKKFYKSTDVRTLFARRAWVNVSQHDKTRDLLLNILNEMPISDEQRRNLEGMREDELKETLLQYLNGVKYLVVMDDIWKTDFWEEVKSIFPDNHNGSRILITSRIKKVALYASSTPFYDLPFLNEDESWELFSKKLFRGQTCPPVLEDLVRQLAKSCRGLPLSIVTLGRLLAIKDKTHRELSPYVDNANSYLDECKEILALSYTHLPRHLRSCFLYLGVYPIDFEIPVKQMIQLWIAEEFISPPNGILEMENVAEGELEKLIDGSLVQVASRSTNGRTKTCRIGHDLLRNLCISKSKELNFLEVLRGNRSISNQPHILSIHSNNIDPYLSLNESQTSRSLLFFSQDSYCFDQNHWTWVLKNFEFLRVLNFGRVDLYTIPSRIEKMTLLRYLRINSRKLKVIPTSICNLTNLETLDMRGTGLKCLPIGIWKLPSLRNLYVSGSVKLPDDWNPYFTAMCNIQVLSTVSLNPQTIRPIVDAKLPNVRKLGLWFQSNESSKEVKCVLSSLVRLSKLQILKIINYSEHRLPNSFPSTITKITLRQVRLKVGGCMRKLGNLPNLHILKIQRCLFSGNLKFVESSFLRLEVLKLEHLRIKNWEVGRSAIPSLMHLVIKECIELTALPQELRSSTRLRDVEILGSNIESETKQMLEQLQMNLGFNLLIKEPRATEPSTSSGEPTENFD